jgi:hypothetical protein
VFDTLLSVSCIRVDRRQLIWDRVFLVATTALGWCLEARAPLAATLVVNFFVGLGTGTINTG